MNENFPDEVPTLFQRARPIALVIFLTAIISTSAIPNLYWKIGVLCASVPLLIYLSLDIYKTLKSAIKSVKVSLNEINNNVINIQDPLHKAAYCSQLGKPEVQVAEKLFKASKEAVRQLNHPKTFNNQEEYINELVRRIEPMINSRKGRIRAACGEKDWQHKGTKRWFEKNYEALRCNVSVNRIFIEEKEWNKKAADQEMIGQANKGINVRFAELKSLKNHPFLHNMPKGFGFVLFDYGNDRPEVIVHNDTLNPDEKSVLFDDPMIVSQFISLFNELSTDAYSNEITSSNVTDVGMHLEKKVLQKSEALTHYIRSLLDHRSSNLQLNFLIWRIEAELQKIARVLAGSIDIYALGRYNYLSEIFGRLLEQLQEGDHYQTISTVDIWSGKNIGNKKFLDATAKALKNNAKIDRIIFVDKARLLNQNEVDYHKQIKSAVELFEKFPEKDNSLFSIKFLFDYIDGDFQEILQYAPSALITESKNSNQLMIRAHNVSNEANLTTPYLNLKFHSNNDNDAVSDSFISMFTPIDAQSISLGQMKDKLFELYPSLK
jgi:hypothetical protein